MSCDHASCQRCQAAAAAFPDRRKRLKTKASGFALKTWGFHQWGYPGTRKWMVWGYPHFRIAANVEKPNVNSQARNSREQNVDLLGFVKHLRCCNMPHRTRPWEQRSFTYSRGMRTIDCVPMCSTGCSLSPNLFYYFVHCFLQVRVSGVAALSGAMRSLSSTFRFRDGNSEHASSSCTSHCGQCFD